LQEFIDKPDRMLATTLVGNNLCNTTMTVLGASLCVRWLGNGQIANTVASLVLTVILLIIGEYLPKAWFQSHPLSRSRRFVDLLRVFAVLFHVIAWPVTRLVSLLIPAAGDASIAHGRARITRQDVRYLFSQESGATPNLDEQKRRMIFGVFALAEKTAAQVMVPRERMVVIKHDTPMSEILDLASRNRIKSFPVYSDQEHRFTGILKLSDLYEHLDEPDLKLPDLLRPPQYISEDTPADDLLPRLRLSRQPMLLIRNDQDRITGFVTTEVVLAEIVGPLYE
jgi:CBS domain containing-hemolysin-like protein